MAEERNAKAGAWSFQRAIGSWIRKGGITKATLTQDGHYTKEPRNNSTGSHNRHIDYTFVYRSTYIKAFAKTMLSKTMVL